MLFESFWIKSEICIIKVMEYAFSVFVMLVYFYIICRFYQMWKSRIFMVSEETVGPWSPVVLLLDYSEMFQWFWVFILSERGSGFSRYRL